MLEFFDFPNAKFLVEVNRERDVEPLNVPRKVVLSPVAVYCDGRERPSGVHRWQQIR